MAVCLSEDPVPRNLTVFLHITAETHNQLGKSDVFLPPWPSEGQIPLSIGSSPNWCRKLLQIPAFTSLGQIVDLLGHRRGDDLIDLLFEVVSVRPSVRPQKVFPISM